MTNAKRAFISFKTLFLITTTNLFTAEANTAPGDNTAQYKAICMLVNLANKCTKGGQATTTKTDTALVVGAINISLASNDFQQAIDTEKDWATLPQDKKNKLGGSEEDWQFWKESKRQLKKHQAWIKTFTGQPKTAAQRLATAEMTLRARKLYEQAQSASATPATSTAQLCKDALYGQGKTSSDGLAAGHATRANVCSDEAAGTNNKAGTALFWDVLCLCGGSSTHANTKQACGKGLEASETRTDWTPNTNDQAAGDPLIQHCATFGGAGHLNAVTLESAWAALQTQIKTDSNTNAGKPLVLGAVDASGAAFTGCTGNKVTNGGQCVQYKAKHFSNGETTIPWLSALRRAAEKAKSDEDNAKKAQQVEKELQLLNDTVIAILVGEKTTTTTAASAEESASKKQQEEAEANCNKIEKDTDCKAKPKCAWDGTAKDPNKKCTLSEEAKKEAAKEAAEKQTGTDGKTNTTGSNSFVIKKAPLLLAVLLF
uniref:Variant surface glycoprotein Mul 4 n=1 Tax=Trypanosoma brucei brucei TaxID=5702 RepID=Q571V9_TRYBB|nr:variant surface glycoprotein Mul 4 [Trypanosoma brucei brucei]